MSGKRLAMMAAMMNKLKSPYDAQVEYLGSTGTQYIDTGITPNDYTKVECTIYSSTSSSWYVFGARDRRNNTMYFVQSGSYSNSTIDCAINGTSISPGWNRETDGASLYNIILESNNTTTNYFIQNVTLNKSYSEPNGTHTLLGDNVPTNIYILALKPNNIIDGTSRIYSFKITKNGTLVRDFIPVRVGNVGYLFDNVSKELFGNVGTGNFTLGPDIVPIEYLESSGTQYIDTGIVVSSNSKVETSGNFTEKPSFYATFIGSLSSTGSSVKYAQFVAKAPNSKYYIQIGNGLSYVYSNVSDLNKHTFIGSIQNNLIKLNIDGTTVQKEFTGELTQNPQLIFTHNGSAISKARMYYCKIWDNDVLVRDFIPVRIGTIGYMYDKVSRQLFGNSGTGDFILGNDI